MKVLIETIGESKQWLNNEQKCDVKQHDEHSRMLNHINQNLTEYLEESQLRFEDLKKTMEELKENQGCYRQMQ